MHIFETFDFPNDCQWADCAHPRRHNAQQTVAIYMSNNLVMNKQK